MQWLADECVAAALVKGLPVAGHDVSYIGKRSERDRHRRSQLAHGENRLLLMEDKDFGDLI